MHQHQPTEIVGAAQEVDIIVILIAFTRLHRARRALAVVDRNVEIADFRQWIFFKLPSYGKTEAGKIR